jgi:hypothetical protein
MPSLVDEAWEWLDRAEQAREVAGLVSDPAARDAVMRLAESYQRLARAAVNPTVLRRRELARNRRKGTRDFIRPLPVKTANTSVVLFFTRESDVGPGRGLNRRPDPR